MAARLRSVDQTKEGSTPCDLAMERDVVAGLMLFPNTYEQNAAELTPELFASPRYNAIFCAVRALRHEGSIADMSTVRSRLSQNDILNSIGGESVFAEMIDTEALPSRMTSYVAELANWAKRRKLYYLGQTAMDLAWGESSADEATLETIRMAESLTLPSVDGGITDFAEIADEALATLGKSVAMCSSGIPSLDNWTGGHHAGEITIVAARPGMGKSSFIVSSMLRAAAKDQPVAFCSLEMSRIEIMHRAASARSKVPFSIIRQGPPPKDYAAIEEALGWAGGLPITVNDRGTQTLFDVKATISKATKRWGRTPALVVVDYLQLMESQRNYENRQVEVSAASRGLKLLAKDLGVPIVALAQLNRGVEARNEKRPALHDLRESGAVENDADVVLGLYRDEMYQPETTQKNVGEILVLKNRHGPTGIVKVGVDIALNKWFELEFRRAS